MPLPYNARLAALCELSISHFLLFPSFPIIPIDKVGFLCYDASIKRSEVAAMFFAAERMLGSRAEELAGRAAMRGACRE